MPVQSKDDLVAVNDLAPFELETGNWKLTGAVMFILDSLLYNGIKFALEKVLQVAEQETDNREGLQQQLLEAQMQLEDGTIDEEAFAEIERDVFARLREMNGAEASGGIADASRFEDIEIEVEDDERS